MALVPQILPEIMSFQPGISVSMCVDPAVCWFWSETIVKCMLFDEGLHLWVFNTVLGTSTAPALTHDVNVRDTMEFYDEIMASSQPTSSKNRENLRNPSRCFQPFHGWPGLWRPLQNPADWRCKCGKDFVAEPFRGGWLFRVLHEHHWRCLVMSCV